ncbi:MAG: hypothetical protein V4613_14955 [Bacteroidota bacterium]
MFDITPKEQTIKQVRKGLVQPLANKYPLLNFESDVFKKPLLAVDEDFVSAWVKAGYSFNTCSNKYDFLSQLLAIKEEKGWGTIATGEKKLMELLDDNGIPHILPDNMKDVLLISCQKMESSSSGICLNSEIQPLKKLSQARHLVIFAKNNQVETPSNNTFFGELMVKNDFRVQLDIAYFKRFESVILLMVM